VVDVSKETIAAATNPCKGIFALYSSKGRKWATSTQPAALQNFSVAEWCSG
jgi:hypothetical protein